MPDNPYSDSDKETMRSDATRLSGSRANAARCKKRKNDQREARIAHAIALKQQRGEETTPALGREEHREVQRRKMLAFMSEGDAPSNPAKDVPRLRGSAISDLSSQQAIAVFRAAADQRKFDKEEYWQRCFTLPKMKVGKRDYFEAEQQCLVDKPDGKFCEACKKYYNEGHANSAGHKAAVQEQAIAELSLGHARSLRRFSCGSGLIVSGWLTKEDVRSFWGVGVDTFPEMMRAIHKFKGFINFRMSQRRVLQLKPRHVERYQLAISSYNPEDCKYEDDRNKAYAWEDLPEYAITMRGDDHAETIHEPLPRAP